MGRKERGRKGEKKIKGGKGGCPFSVYRCPSS